MCCPITISFLCATVPFYKPFPFSCFFSCCNVPFPRFPSPSFFTYLSFFLTLSFFCCYYLLHFPTLLFPSFPPFQPSAFSLSRFPISNLLFFLRFFPCFIVAFPCFSSLFLYLFVSLVYYCQPCPLLTIICFTFQPSFLIILVLLSLLS